MARKRRKIFPKEQLLQLFENKNYQKVVSKIKQFTIEDMSEDELLKIHLNSLVNLSSQHFEIGDIQRALRDIELALVIQISSNIQFLKLKYLCYLEKFKEAYEYSKSLLDTKDMKIKKDIVFYYFISNIYYDHSIDKDYLKFLTQAKQNYILGLLAFFQDDMELCLKYLDKCNPRLKVEKENLKALKSIILNKDYLEYEGSKPLYKFLLLGDDENLQNTKNTRENKQIVLKQFKQQKSNNTLQNLIELKHPIDNSLLKQQNNIKLVFNNIALLLEIDNNYEEALNLFLYNKDKLVDMPESIYLLLKIYEMDKENISSGQKTIWFIKKYLLLHKDKLSPFALKYIFYAIFTDFTHLSDKDINNQYIQIAKEYQQLPIQSVIQEFSNPHTKNIEKFQEHIVNFFNTFDKINEKAILQIIGGIEQFKYYLDAFTESLDNNAKEAMVTTIDTNVAMLIKVKNPDTKYEKSIFKLFDVMSQILLEFDINVYFEQFKNLENAINYFIDIYNYNRDNLSQNILQLSAYISSGVATNKNNKNHFENTLDRLKKMISDDLEFDEDDEFDDFFDEDNLEYEFGEIFGEFKMALKSGENPYKCLSPFPRFYSWFFEREFESIAFDLMSEYARFKNLTQKVIEKIFKLTGFELGDEIVRKRLPTILNEYAEHSPEITLQILEYLIEFKKSYETAWYMQWLYIYLNIAYKNSKKQNKIYKTIIARFVEIQKKKKFTTFNKKYEKIVKMFKLEDIEYDGSYEQQSFEF